MGRYMTVHAEPSRRGELPAAVLARIGVEPPVALRCRTPGGASFHVSRLRRVADEATEWVRLPNEDGWAVHVQLRNVPSRCLMVDGVQTPAGAYREGAASLCDLRRDIKLRVTSPFDCIRVFLPRAALDELAEEFGTRPVVQLAFEHGRQVEDPVLRNLAAGMLPAMQRPGETNVLFMDHMALALRAHIATTYGMLQAPLPAPRGGLAPWQERRARELLEANLEGGVSLEDIAGACRLSASYFARAFKQSTGLAPHRWLLQRRVSKAKTLLRDPSLSLAEVALECGFADQSHFTRVFGQWFGTTPGAWRRWAGANPPDSEPLAA
jgi:AraC family transcriptional regulator